MIQDKKRYKIICGSIAGVEKKALEMVVSTISDFVSYTVPVLFASEISEEDLANCNLLVIGTKENNRIIKELEEKEAYTAAKSPEGYAIKITRSPYDATAQIIIISGFDARGVLYGAIDFNAYYIPSAENAHNSDVYIRELFCDEELPKYEKTSVPSVRQRGMWTWGHVVYDYRNYLENMMRLKMNTLILWNDFVPVNISDVLETAKECGIDVYLGYSWGWDQARNKELDISDESQLERISDDIVNKYKNSYLNLPIKGIYFQSFTETSEEVKNGKIIAESVVSLVNKTAEKIFRISPDLSLQFGLHASSVNEKLEYIRKTDSRVTIVWEDCGAFPYNYLPEKIEDFDKTCKLTREIATLRGEKERFGVVTKGFVCLNWQEFEYQAAPYVMGRFSKDFIEKRFNERKKIWNQVSAFWLQNASYAYDMIKLINKSNKDALVVGLVEDGLFEKCIWMPVALYAEMLWDCSADLPELLKRVNLRHDVV